MILCLDAGNSHIFGGIFVDNEILLRFRHDSQLQFSSDQFGVFLKQLLREHNIHDSQLKHIAICSVVPHLDYTLKRACEKYFSVAPLFLQAGVKTGLKINYRNPLEVGADRISNAIAATDLFPNKNILVVDFGTATTLCAIRADHTYLGGVIMAGMRLGMNALQSKTAKLSTVEIVKPTQVLGRSTKESIQTGLYYAQYAAIKELCKQITEEQFDSPPVIIGTGGFAHLFSDTGLFDVIESDLVLHGLRIMLAHNPQPEVFYDTASAE